MLRAAMATARSAVYVLVGVFTFTAPWPGAADGAAEIAVYAVAGILMAWWAAAGIWDRSGRLVPWALGGVAVACGVASALPGGGNLIALSLIAVIAAASGGRLAIGWIVAGSGMAAAGLAGLVVGTSGWVRAEYLTLLLVGLLLGLSRRDYRIRAEQSAALAARSEQLRKEEARTAALDERTRIAREIHDVLAHSLGALGLHIQLAQAVLTDQHDEERAIDLLEQARRMTSDGLAETRRAVQALRGQIPPLPEGLAQLSVDHQRRHGASVTFQVSGEPRVLPPDAGLTLTRTAQEALVNAAKHAPHQPVQLRLDYADTSTNLVVTSQLDGSGSDHEFATINGGYGLTGMRERLLLLGGTLSAGPSGSDWVVEARVPA